MFQAEQLLATHIELLFLQLLNLLYTKKFILFVYCKTQHHKMPSNSSNYTIYNPVVIPNTTNSTSLTTGAEIITGGEAVGGNLYVGGNINDATLNASESVATDSSKNLISIAHTGTGNNVRAISPSLSTSILFAGSTSGVITLQPQAAAGTYNFNYPTTAGSSGQVLTSAAGNTSPMTWTTPTTGTVTSVSASVPSFLSVSGSPITSSGTLAITLSGTALPVVNGGTGTTTSTGSGSVVLSASPTFTGTITAATVTASGLITASAGLTSTAGTTSLSTTNVTGVLDMGSNKITGLATPTLGTDAVNKTYVDGGNPKTTTGSQSTTADVSTLVYTSEHFEVNIAVHVIATTNLSELFKLSGILSGNTGTGWAMTSTSIAGDVTGVSFTINGSGQIRYTSPSFTGFSSLTFNWKQVT